MPSVMVATVGFNPARVLNAQATLRAEEVVLVASRETEFYVDVLAPLLRRAGANVVHEPIIIHPYLLGPAVTAIGGGVDAALSSGSVKPTITFALTGGTKVAMSAMAWAANSRGAEMLHSSGRSWINRAGRTRLGRSVGNLTPHELGTLHACTGVSGAQRVSVEPGTVRKLLGLLDSKRAPNEQAFADFERAANQLVAAVLPGSFAMYGSTTFTLRDTDDPRIASGRKFEIDGLAIRGTRAWVIESKFKESGIVQLRTHAAEVRARARHLGGDDSRALLVFRSDELADYLTQESADPFTRLIGVGPRMLREAAEALLSGGNPAQTELGRLFV